MKFTLILTRNLASAISLSVAAITCLSLEGATYDVAQSNPKASDNGPGSSEQPWKTVSKAAGMVGPGDLVLIHEGVYRERVLLNTSGTSQKPIRFQAAPGAYVILTGAD